MKTKTVDILKNQSGAALVIALILLIVITLISLASSFTSIFEIKLAGNKRGSTDAFFAADSGIHVVVADISNFDLPGKYDVGNKYLYSKDPAVLADLDNMNPTKADITIYYDSTQAGPPRGLGFSATGNYEFMHYTIESTGKDQMDLNLLKSTCTLQQKVVRLVPTQQGGN
jgi:hypothetical protein